MRIPSRSELLSSLAVAAVCSACASAPPSGELKSQTGVPPASQTPATVLDPSQPQPETRSAAAVAADASEEPVTPSVEPVAAKGSEAKDLSNPVPDRREDRTLIVIEEAAVVVPTQRDLIGASQREKARRERAGAPVAVITDKNLADHARSGRVTTGPAPAVTAPVVANAAASAAATEAAAEVGWRERIRGLRQAWRDSSDALAGLEKDVADQRVRFYAEDDPYVRDGRIKPAWDLALDRLEHGRRSIENSRAELSQVLAEGRSAGIPPGWLDEGIELEPALVAEQPPRGAPREPQSGAESREPNVVNEPPSAEDPPR